MRRWREIHHLAYDSFLCQLHHRQPDAEHSPEDHRRNDAELPGPGASGAGGELGVLLKDAQNFRSISGSPWLLLPGVFVILTVLSFNLVGDGLRDAADLYSA